MKRENDLIISYSTSHQNQTNQLIHFFCVPVIFFNVVAVIFALTPAWFFGILVALTLVFYFRSMRSFLPHMIVLYLATLSICAIFATHPWFVPVNLGIFVLAWIGQFWGHKIEGKKPSFFQDVFFLLVGPAWVMEKLKLKILKRRA
jgi:uncharacterized membrane protein YGL010W